MAASGAVTIAEATAQKLRNVGPRAVRPILSTSHDEARANVIRLYKACYRQAPKMQLDYRVQKSALQIREKIKELFMRNKAITDIRAIDMMVVRGRAEFHDTLHMHKQSIHFMHYWRQTEEPRPTDFMGKFLDGHDP